MTKHFRYIFILIISAALMAGCNIEDVFVKLATSEEEQGARERYVRNQMVEAKQKRIEEKRQQFTTVVKLTKVNESDPYEAFVFTKASDDLVTIDVEAILPNPGRQIYEIWLRNPGTKETKSLGALQYNQTDDYSLSYTGDIDIEAFNSVILTREANPDNQPETVILTGSLTSSTP